MRDLYPSDRESRGVLAEPGEYRADHSCGQSLGLAQSVQTENVSSAEDKHPNMAHIPTRVCVICRHWRLRKSPIHLGLLSS